MPLTARNPDLFLSSVVYIALGGLPCSILGFILTLVAAFSNRCNCCKSSSCCCLCFSEPFQFGALVTSSPNIPFILGPDGQLVKEGETDIEENKEEELEMEESKDINPSTSNSVLTSETEVELEADKVTKEKEEAA